jgi:two-component system cell cycle sensor histidine kinase/response regulator CckA
MGSERQEQPFSSAITVAPEPTASELVFLPSDSKHPANGMPDRSKIVSRVAGVIWVGSLAALLGVWPLFYGASSGSWLEHASYDSLHRLSTDAMPLNAMNAPVVLVYLDPATYRAAGLDPLRPWPRQVHAQLVRRLTEAGARAVAFDILFAGPGPDPEADRDLAGAIRESGCVVLAGEYDIKSSHLAEGDNATGARSRSWSPPFGPFAEAAAGWGLAVIRIDDDLVVRRHFAGLVSESKPSLAHAVAKQIGVKHTSELTAEWMRYYGPALSLPHVSYAEALSSDALPAGFFRDKIVFIGARSSEGSFDQPRDEFRSPFHSWGRKEFFMPGVEVHATQLLNLLRQDGLHRGSRGVELVVLAGIGLGLAASLMWLRPVWATAGALAAVVVAMVGSMMAFRAGTWFPWLLVGLVQAPTAWGGSVLFQSVEWYRARRQLEAERRIAQERIREQAALIDAAHDAILVQTIDGAVTYANPSAERLFGRSLAELREHSALQDLFSPQPDLAARARAVALKDGDWNGELLLRAASGAILIASSRWTLIRDGCGQPKALLLVNRDVSEQKALEAQFLRTQRMNTIGALAAGMAHDLNNALAPVLMGVQILRRNAVDDESRRMLQMIEDSTHRGAGMVRQVLHFARGGAASAETVDLAGLVRDLEHLVRDTFPHGIKLETFLPPDLRPVRGRPTELHQILLNLAVNARDAMPAGGRLTFAADNVELSAEEAAAIPGGRPGRFVSLMVSDTGTGMTPEVRARLFEAFFTTKAEGAGTGIGLSTVQRIVESHEGFVRVESEPGQGTTFEVFLPVATETEAAPRSDSLAGLPRGQGERILVADDELAIRELLVDGLTAEGYCVLAAPNVAVALQLLQDQGSEIRLLITGNSMPGMDGPSLVREARKLRSGLPVILSGADSAASSEENTRLLPKPFSLDELLLAVAQALGKTTHPT